MSSVTYLTVKDDENGKRFDRWFKNRFPIMTQGHLQKLLRTGQIRIDGCRAKANERVKSGQKIRIPPVDLSLEPKRTRNVFSSFHSIEKLLADLHGRILYKDNDILAIDKPGGLPVQGGSKISLHVDAALDGLMFEKKERPRLVHRLDRDTSGVLLLARTDKTARWLSAAFKGHETRKLYWALVSGAPNNNKGIIDLSLEKLPSRQGEKVVPTERGKIAKTIYRVVDRASRHAAWLAMEPTTGRTHQLRVHTALGLNTPIIGDGKYGGARAFPNGIPFKNSMQLHARAMRIRSPHGTEILIEAPLPEAMAANFKYLGFSENDEKAKFADEVVT